MIFWGAPYRSVGENASLNNRFVFSSSHSFIFTFGKWWRMLWRSPLPCGLMELHTAILKRKLKQNEMIQKQIEEDRVTIGVRDPLFYWCMSPASLRVLWNVRWVRFFVLRAITACVSVLVYRVCYCLSARDCRVWRWLHYGIISCVCWFVCLFVFTKNWQYGGVYQVPVSISWSSGFIQHSWNSYLH